MVAIPSNALRQNRAAIKSSKLRTLCRFNLVRAGRMSEQDGLVITDLLMPWSTCRLWGYKGIIGVWLEKLCVGIDNSMFSVGLTLKGTRARSLFDGDFKDLWPQS